MTNTHLVSQTISHFVYPKVQNIYPVSAVNFRDAEWKTFPSYFLSCFLLGDETETINDFGLPGRILTFQCVIQ